jgi:4-amino-4-deoxy-L-arabinose transferase-like glycosyltransferase
VFDVGRELELPRRLLAGERLYAELRWYYGPVAPYVNAVLYAAFGVKLAVLEWAGTLVGVSLAVVVYRLARRFTGRAVATSVAIAFSLVCAFQHLSLVPIFTFGLPYTFAATYGMAAAAGSLLGLVLHVQRGRGTSLWWSTVLLAVASLSKLETAAPALAAHSLFLALTWADRRLTRASIYPYFVAAGLVVSVWGPLAAQSGTALWSGNLAALGNAGSRVYVARTMGLLDPIMSLRAVGESTLIAAAVMAVAWAAGTVRQRARHHVAGAIRLAVAGAVPLVVYGALDPELAFRWLPLGLGVALAVALGQWWRQPERRAELLPEILLFAFGTGALLRIVLRVSPHHYGFYLLPIGLVGAAVLVSETLPRWSGQGKGPWAAAATGLLLGCSFAAARVSAPGWEAHTIPVETRRGRLSVTAIEAPLASAVVALSDYPAESRTMVVPQGGAIAWFAGLPSAGVMFSYLPMELPGLAEDAALASSLARDPPDIVVALMMDLSEYGYRGFGRDYALRTGQWIAQEYTEVREVSPQVLILRRGPGRGTPHEAP